MGRQSRDEVNDQRRAHYAEDADYKAKVKARNAVYYQRNKDGWNANQKQGADRPRNLGLDRDWLLRTRYGITSDDYDRILKEQDGQCAICGTDKTGDLRQKYFHVDHDHTTGKVRGLLCRNCNIALGLMKDDAEIVMAMAAYLIQQEDLLHQVRT